MSDAVLPLPADSEPANQDITGPICEKCGAVNESTACPSCGWYAVLGIHVEIDSAYESLVQPQSDADEQAPTKTESLAKHVEVWKGMIPLWAWVIIGTVITVIAAGVFARVATEATPVLRTYISVTTLISGVFVLLAAHITGFVLISSDDADVGLADVLIKPFKSWLRLCGELPKRLWLIDTGAASLTAALTAALIIGGIPYERLLDWGFKARAKPNLVGMIASQAAKAEGGGKDSLEDSVGEFAAMAGDIEPKQPEPVPRQKLDALIIGYRTSPEGELLSLLLAAGTGGNQLKFIGEVRPKLNDKDAEILLKKFAKHPASKPLVKTSASGEWVAPRFTCRASYTKWPKGKKPRDLRWEEMLEEVKLPW